MHTPVKPSLTLKRRFNAPPERVYAAWTQPDQISRWFGPAGIVVTSAAFDARVGGAFRISATASDGERHQVGGVIREVVPNRRLVYTWAWHTTQERQSLVTVEFKPDGEGTLLTLTHEQFFDEAAQRGHIHGWTGTLAKLEALFA